MHQHAQKDVYRKHRQGPSSWHDAAGENGARAGLPLLARLPAPLETGSADRADAGADAGGVSAEPVASLLYGEAFSRVARQYRAVIGVRAPNPLGESLLKEGRPSKNFHMKAKSSPSGPTAGFITEHPRYSKVGPSSYAKQAASVSAALGKGARAVGLVLSNARIDELLDSGNLVPLGQGRYRATYPGGVQEFVISADGHVFDREGQPVRVLTNPPEAGAGHAHPDPITADYDLFAIIPRASRNYNLRALSSPPRLLPQAGRWRAMRGPGKLAAKKNSFDFLQAKSLRGEQEDANMGNLHHFGKSIVKALNAEVARQHYAGGKLVWHNDETGNPFSPGFDPADRPIFFLPSGEVRQLDSRTQLLRFYAELEKDGYAPEYSPVFGF